MFSLRFLLFFLGLGLFFTLSGGALQAKSSLTKPFDLQKESPLSAPFLEAQFPASRFPAPPLFFPPKKESWPYFCELSTHPNGTLLSLRDSLTGTPLKNIAWRAQISLLAPKEKNTPLEVAESISLSGHTDHTGIAWLKLPPLFQKQAHLLKLSFERANKTFTCEKLFLSGLSSGHSQTLPSFSSVKEDILPKPPFSEPASPKSAHLIRLLSPKSSFLWSETAELLFLCTNFAGQPLTQGTLEVELSSPSQNIKLEKSHLSLPINTEGIATLNLPLNPSNKEAKFSNGSLRLQLTLPPPPYAPTLPPTRQSFTFCVAPLSLSPSLAFSKNWASLSEPFSGEAQLLSSNKTSTPFVGEISLYKITYNKYGSAQETKTYSASLHTNAEGKTRFSVQAPEVGFFRCEVKFATPQASTPFSQASAFFYALGSPEENAKLILPEHTLRLIPEKPSYEEGEAPRFLIVSSPALTHARLSLNLGQKGEKNISLPLTPPLSVVQYPFSLEPSAQAPLCASIPVTLSCVGEGKGWQTQKTLPLSASEPAPNFKLKALSLPAYTELFSAQATPLLSETETTPPTTQTPAKTAMQKPFSLLLQLTLPEGKPLENRPLHLSLTPLQKAPAELPSLGAKLLKNPFLPPPAPWQQNYVLDAEGTFLLNLPENLPAGLYQLSLEVPEASPPHKKGQKEHYYLALSPPLASKLLLPQASSPPASQAAEVPRLLNAQLSNLLEQDQALSYSLHVSPSLELLCPSEGTLSLEKLESRLLSFPYCVKAPHADAYFCLTVWGKNATSLTQSELTLPAQAENPESPSSEPLPHTTASALSPEIEPTGQEAFDLAWRLGIGWGQHHRESFLYWLKRAQKDYPPALFIAAKELLSQDKSSPEGLLLAQEALTALLASTQEASQKDPDSWAALGNIGLSPLFETLLLKNRPSPEQSLVYLQKAEQLLEKASEEGSLYAAYRRALLYEGEGSLRCPEKALFYYQKAAEKGYPPALYALGKKAGAKKNYPVALNSLEQAYQSLFIPAGELLAQYLWELSSLKKEDAPALQEKALFYLEDSAQKGAPLAQQALSALYAEGEQLPLDAEKSAFWLQKAQKESVALPPLEANPLLKALRGPKFTLPMALSLASFPLPKKFPKLGQGLEQLTLKELLDEWEKKTPQALTELIHRYSPITLEDSTSTPTPPVQDVYQAIKLHKKALSGDARATYQLIELLQDSDFEEDQALSEAWLELLAESQHEKALLLLAQQLSEEQPQKALSLYEALAERHSEEAQKALIELFEHTGNGASLNFPRAKAYKAQLEEDLPGKKLLKLLKQELSSTTKPSEELLTLLSLLADNKSFSPTLQKEFKTLSQERLPPSSEPPQRSSQKKSQKNK